MYVTIITQQKYQPIRNYSNKFNLETPVVRQQKPYVEIVFLLPDHRGLVIMNGMLNQWFRMRF